MFDKLRFGKRLPFPSTVQIIHELKMLILEDRIKDLQKEMASARSATPKPHSGEEPCGDKSP